MRPRLLSNKVSIRLDYGQERNFWVGDMRIRDEKSGKVKKFNSDVDVLNYMSAKVGNSSLPTLFQLEMRETILQIKRSYYKE